MWFWGWKQRLALFTALLIACAVLGSVRVANALPLSSLNGAHTYYTYSPSSQAQVQTKLNGLDFLHLQGESVTITLTEQDKCDLHSYTQTVFEKYKAQVLCIEQTNETVSYYGYSPMLKGGVTVQGKKVNLHVAFSKDHTRCVVGTPIIFGGF